MSHLMTVSEVAKFLGLSRAYVYRLRKANPDFPQPIYLTPKAPRFRREEIEAWIDARQARAA